jgi:WD40 repeat protein
VTALKLDGELLVSGSVDNTVRVWNVQTKEQLHLLQGHSKTVRSVTLTADRTKLLSGSGTLLYVHTLHMLTSVTR